jgi:DNA-binding Xre family transcriptional regulator
MKRIISVTELARELGCSNQNITAIIRRGGLPKGIAKVERIGSNRILLYRKTK